MTRTYFVSGIHRGNKTRTASVTIEAKDWNDALKVANDKFPWFAAKKAREV
jgi:hypothetical protein